MRLTHHDQEVAVGLCRKRDHGIPCDRPKDHPGKCSPALADLERLTHEYAQAVTEVSRLRHDLATLQQRNTQLEHELKLLRRPTGWRRIVHRLR